MRACVRPPVAITSPNTISSRRGASQIVISAVPKWLRTYAASMWPSADRRSTGLMPDRAMLEFAVTADDRALAIGFDGVLAAQPLAQRSGQLPAEIAQVSLKRHQVRLIAAGMGIVDDGERGADQ